MKSHRDDDLKAALVKVARAMPGECLSATTVTQVTRVTYRDEDRTLVAGLDQAPKLKTGKTLKIWVSLNSPQIYTVQRPDSGSLIHVKTADKKAPNDGDQCNVTPDQWAEILQH